MGIFSFKKKGAIPTSVINPWFISIKDFQRYVIGDKGHDDSKYLKYYETIPELQSVINYRAKCFASMKVKMRNLKTDTEIESDPILTLLNQPNVLQSGQEFFRQFSTYKDIFGNDFIYMLFGTDVSKTKALWNLPPIDIEVLSPKDVKIWTATNYAELIKGYKLKIDNKETELTPEEVIHFYDNLIIKNDKLNLKGTSKVHALSQTLENIKISYEARGIILGNSPLGIISNESQDASGTVPLNEKDKQEVQSQMRTYGTALEKHSYVITNARLKWQSMATTVTEQHFKEVTEDMRTICNEYSFPPDLMLAGSTYENIKQAKKQLYQDSIIPEAEDFLSGLSSGLGLIDNNKILYPDFSHIAVLQTDYETKARTYNTMVMALSKAFADGAITVQQYTEQLTKIGMI